jgi:hypothetical protein
VTPKKKTTKKSPPEVGGIPMANGLTMCEQFIKDNPEVLAGFSLTITGREQALLRVRSCRGPVRILAFIDRENGQAQRLIADAPDVGSDWREISLQAFSTLIAGQNYVLTWVMDGPADDWQVVSELTMDGTVHYRHLKKRRAGVMNGELLMIKVRPT